MDVSTTIRPETRLNGMYNKCYLAKPLMRNDHEKRWLEGGGRAWIENICVA